MAKLFTRDAGKPVIVYPAFDPSFFAGVYAAAGAGLAVGGGVRAIVLTNQNGAILELSGRQVGLMANADLSGLAITMT